MCCGKRQGCEKWADVVLLVTQDHSDMQAFAADYGHVGVCDDIHDSHYH